MNLFGNLVLSISGGLVVGSILMAKIGFSQSVLSRKGAAILAGVGAGLGVGIFIYYGASGGDFVGSVITSIIVTLVVGLSVIIPSRWWHR